MRLALAAVALVVAVGPGWAAEIPLPLYDVDKGCAIWNTPDEPEGGKGCIQLEQQNYDYAKSVWFDTPIYVRRYCIDMNLEGIKGTRATSLNPKSRTQDSFFYSLLAFCLKPEMRHIIPKPLPDKFRP